MLIAFTIPGVPVAQPRQLRFAMWDAPAEPRMRRWTMQEREFLAKNYPTKGKMFCAAALGRREGQVRSQAESMGLRLDGSSEFFKDFQRRAAASKVGRKRPCQAIVMRALHAQGKLKPSEKTRAAISARMKKHIAEHGHNRGFAGKRHSEEARIKIGKESRRSWKVMSKDKKRQKAVKMLKTKIARGNLVSPRPNASWKAAWREVGGQRVYFRSRWEANYARFLQWRKVAGDIRDWEHEPETFWFDGIKRGCVSYLPDFRVTLADGRIEYHEVKGWMDARSKTKIKRMRKYHPKTTLVVVDAKAYKTLCDTVSKAISGWET